MSSLAKLVLACQHEVLQCTKQTVTQHHLLKKPQFALKHSALVFRDHDSTCKTSLPSRCLTTHCQQSSKLKNHFVQNSGTCFRLFQLKRSCFNEAQLLGGSCRHSSHSAKDHDKPLVAKFTEEIDVEQLKDELRQKRKEGGVSSQLQLTQTIRQAVAAKCDEAIANLSEEEEKQLKVIQLEHNFLYSEGYDILRPEEMTSEYWLEAMNQPSKMSRLKYYLFLQKRIYLRARGKKKQAGKVDSDRTPGPVYEHGRIFMRIYESTMRRWLTYRLASEMQFGKPLIFDMDFHNEMKAQDVRNTAKQLIDVYGFNRMDEGTPFHLHMVNCQEDNSIYKLFQIFLQDTPDVMVTVSDKSYLDMFDKKDLIYLSPNGRQVMREFDPTAVYIVGAFNDKSSNKPITYARAREQGIRCQRLPLNEHLDWVQGRKDLTLDQVMRILTAVKNKQPWREAFKAVPSRKLTRYDD